jgi:hypothetical protein
VSSIIAVLEIILVVFGLIVTVALLWFTGAKVSFIFVIVSVSRVKSIESEKKPFSLPEKAVLSRRESRFVS